MNKLARRARSFGAFWWDFIVGDDWRIAAGIIVAMGLTRAIAAGDVAAWWVLPAGVVLMLALSLRRGVRRDP